MTGTPAARGPFRVDVVDDMTIEWDVPIETDDGGTLRADVFRPTATGTYPTIVSYGPYAKGLPFQQGFPAVWQKRSPITPTSSRVERQIPEPQGEEGRVGLHGPGQWGTASWVQFGLV